MLQINDIVKRQKHSKVLYKVVGFDYPLPLMGGGIKVIIIKIGKKAQTTRVNISHLYNEDGTKIKEKEKQ